jgi:hypothetical protein
MATAKNTFAIEIVILSKPYQIRIEDDVPLYGSVEITCIFQEGQIVGVEVSGGLKTVPLVSRVGGAL